MSFLVFIFDTNTNYSHFGNVTIFWKLSFRILTVFFVSFFFVFIFVFCCRFFFSYIFCIYFLASVNLARPWIFNWVSVETWLGLYKRLSIAHAAVFPSLRHWYDPFVSVMVTIVGNGRGYSSSWSWLFAFYIVRIPLAKAWILLFSLQLRVKKKLPDWTL